MVNALETAHQWWAELGFVNERPGQTDTLARLIDQDRAELEAENERLKQEIAKADAKLALETAKCEFWRKADATSQSQLAEARKELEPFADIADLIDSETEGMSETDELELHFHDYLMASWPVSMFRAARRALTGGKNGQ